MNDLLKSRYLEDNLKSILSSREFVDKEISVVAEHDEWKIGIMGSPRYWAKYPLDFSFIFSRRHPFDAPIIKYAQNSQNNLRHPVPRFVTNDIVKLDIVNPSGWNGIQTTVLDIIREIQKSLNAPRPAFSNAFICQLPNNVQMVIFELISIQDICNFSVCSKAVHAICNSQDLWADLYFQQCMAHQCYLNLCSSPGPLRMQTTHGDWVWCDSKNAFVSAYQMFQFHPKNKVNIETNIFGEIHLLGRILTGAVNRGRRRNAPLDISTMEFTPELVKFLQKRFFSLSQLSHWIASREKLVQWRKNYRRKSTPHEMLPSRQPMMQFFSSLVTQICNDYSNIGVIPVNLRNSIRRIEDMLSWPEDNPLNQWRTLHLEETETHLSIRQTNVLKRFLILCKTKLRNNIYKFGMNEIWDCAEVVGKLPNFSNRVITSVMSTIPYWMHPIENMSTSITTDEEIDSRRSQYSSSCSTCFTESPWGPTLADFLIVHLEHHTIASYGFRKLLPGYSTACLFRWFRY